MTNQEAIKELEWVKERGFVADKGIIGTDRIVEAVGIAIEALEKQISKKPVIKIHDNRIPSEQNQPYCPNCDEYLGWLGWQGYEEKYCDNCGQAIDWSEVE